MYFRTDGRRRRREAAIEDESIGDVASAQSTLEAVEMHRRLCEIMESLAAPVRAVLTALFPGDVVLGDRTASGPVGLAVRSRLGVGLAEMRRKLDDADGDRRGRWRAVLLPLVALPQVGPVITAAVGLAVAAVVVLIAARSWPPGQGPSRSPVSPPSAMGATGSPSLPSLLPVAKHEAVATALPEGAAFGTSIASRESPLVDIFALLKRRMDQDRPELFTTDRLAYARAYAA